MWEPAILDKLSSLPDDKKRQVLDYVEYLAERYGQRTLQPGFDFKWAGGLAELRQKYSSVALQHEASKWR